MTRYFLTKEQAQAIIKSIPKQEWDVELEGSYGVVIAENDKRQVIAKNDAFGGRIAFTVQSVKREIPEDAKVLDPLDAGEIDFLKRVSPHFYAALLSLIC